MVTNSSMTHYHKSFNSTTRLDEWIRYNYTSVMFQGGEGSSLNKGIIEANDVKVRIPYNLNSNIDIDNFSIGDIIVKGTLSTNITKQSDLSEHEVYNITSLINNNYGGTDIQHIHIEGK
jgi:hypothetical protein